MRRSLVIVGLLSATVLTLMVSPSHSEDINTNPTQGGQPDRVVSGNSGAAGKGGSADGDPLRIAQAERDGRDRAMFPPPDHDERRFVPHYQDRDEARRPPPDGPDGELDDCLDPRLGLAAGLSALETYIGITSAQLDVWRAYTTALITFLEPPELPKSSDRERPPAPPGSEGTARPPQGAVPFFAESLADGAIAWAEKAKALKQGIDALRSTLSAEQLDRLAKAERPFGLDLPFSDPTNQEAYHHGPADERLPPPPSEIDRSPLPEPQLSR